MKIIPAGNVKALRKLADHLNTWIYEFNERGERIGQYSVTAALASQPLTHVEKDSSYHTTGVVVLAENEDEVPKLKTILAAYEETPRRKS